MKNKFKIFTLGVISVFALPSVVNAATLTLDGKTNGNTATYTIKYTKAESDTKSTITFEIANSAEVLTPVVNKKLTDGTCNSTGCTVTLPEGDYTNVPVELATVTLENSSDSAVDTTLSLRMDGNTTDTKQIKLEAGKTQTTAPVTTRQRSNDASLTGINVSNGTFDQNFNRDVLSYNITGIKDTINSVTVTPECDNNCSWDITCPTGDCTISNSRKVSLRTGANQVGVNVTSEDGTSKKTYILNIYRGDIVINSPYLSSIKIDGIKLSPNFDSLVNDYTATVGLDVDKLDIITVAEDPNADIIIKGNENLVEGENTITITVTSSDGANKQVYSIIVTKEKKEEKKKEKKKVTTTNVKKKKNKTLLIVILSILGLGLIVGTYFLIFKLKKNKKNDKNNKNDKGTPISNINETSSETKVEEQNPLENTGEIEMPNSAEPTIEDLEDDTPKQDIDEALDDLMQTKKLELGDLDF